VPYRLGRERTSDLRHYIRRATALESYTEAGWGVEEIAQGIGAFRRLKAAI